MEFDDALDMEFVRLDKSILCQDCMVEMRHVDKNLYRCIRCGQNYYSK
ncbi:MAG: hypothetical protein V1740_05090 [Candidatus Woesearchaeota archaeon]